MQPITNPSTGKTSVLASLRSLLPNRRLSLAEALRLAELQANRLLAISGTREAPIASEILTELPGVSVDYDLDMPASGSSDWDKHHRHWVITLRASEPDTRHRFTMMHEYKHIIDHGSLVFGVSETAGQPSKPPAEIVADYFAACVLMPKRLIKSAYCGGTQSVGALAELFEVSEAAMRVRLGQLGLTRPFDEPADTWRTPSAIARHGRYQRALSRTWLSNTVEVAV